MNEVRNSFFSGFFARALDEVDDPTEPCRAGALRRGQACDGVPVEQEGPDLETGQIDMQAAGRPRIRNFEEEAKWSTSLRILTQAVLNTSQCRQRRRPTALESAGSWRSLGEECSRHRRQERGLLFLEFHLGLHCPHHFKNARNAFGSTGLPLLVQTLQLPVCHVPRQAGTASALQVQSQQAPLKCPVGKRVHIGGLKLPALLGQRACNARAQHFTCVICALSRWKAKSTMGVNQLKASTTLIASKPWEDCGSSRLCQLPSQLLAMQDFFQVRARMSPPPANR